MELILTLDVGTTSVKACLFDRQLRQTALTSREYALQTRGVCAEAEAQVYLDAAAQCILALPAEARAKVCAVALTTQGETLLCVDRQGKALRPAIVWLDSRAEAQAARLAAALDRQRFYERTGLPELSGALPLAKLLWLREQEPESWARTDKFLLLEDYLMLWLTGRAVTEKSLLTSTGYFDLQSDDYWDEALALAELDRTRLPQALACGSIVGPVLPEVAEALGLPASACVVTGAMDQTAAALAAGCTRPGTLCETTGTAMVAAAFTAHPQFSEDHHVTIYRHAMPGAYLYLPISNTIGMSLRWFRDEFCRDLDGSYAALDRLAEQVPPGAQGVTFLPYLAFQLRDFLNMLSALGCTAQTVTSLGGGAGSALWMQIKADACRRPFHTLSTVQATSRGAAMLAAGALGWALHDAEEQTVYQPQAETADAYEEAYAAYRRVYEALYLQKG